MYNTERIKREFSYYTKAKFIFNYCEWYLLVY